MFHFALQKSDSFMTRRGLFARILSLLHKQPREEFQMKKLAIAALVASSFCTAQVSAQDLTVTITNLTNGMTFTPALVAAHSASGNLFDIGSPASANLQAMAEGGSLTGLQSDLDAISATHTAAAGFLMAGGNVSLTLNTGSATANTKLSVVSMILPTNDAFIGLDAINIPSAAGTYHYDVNAYDAGTETNDEQITGGGAPGAAGIPVDPSGKNGTGGTGVAGADDNTNVHIHRGAIGDSNATGGSSDLDNTVHRWLNPVARVTVVVK